MTRVEEGPKDSASLDLGEPTVDDVLIKRAENGQPLFPPPKEEPAPTLGKDK